MTKYIYYYCRSLISIFAIVYAVGTPFATAPAGLFDKFNLIIVLILFFIVGNSLCIIAPNYFMLAAAMIIIALASGTLLSISMAFVPDIASENKHAAVVSWLYVGFSIASVFGVHAEILAASMNSFAFNFGIAFGSMCGSLFLDNIRIKHVGTGGGILAIIFNIGSFTL